MSKHTIKFYKLKELCNDIIDCPHSTPIWRNQGIPIIRNYNLSNDILTPHNLSYVDEKTYLERIKRAKPEVNDIIISREAPMGAVGLVPHNFICCLGQRTVLLKVNKNKCLPQYLFYALMSKFVQKQIQIINQTGSIVSNLNITDLKNLIVPIVDNQNKIALLLTNILEKIRSNNKINAELEAMTKTIYDYWFLQFEFPNEEGKPYKSSGGKMVWNEELKREIPEGWEVKKLKELFQFIKGKTAKSLVHNQINKDFKPYITIDVANGEIPKYCNDENMIICNGETIMVMDGASSGDIYVGIRGILGSTFAMLLPIDNSISSILIYHILQKYKDIYKKVNTGSTVPHANKDFIGNINVALPKDLSFFNSTFTSISKKIILNKKENRELISLRDFLLPLLMNGQVGFKEDKAEG